MWSEHVAVLRFISCSEQELLFGNLEDFVKPREGAEDENYDLSLLKNYHMAISQKQLKPDTVPFKIAEFYLANK